ncbi:PREDICTED: uncharacterized protein LOC105558745 isoform X2 [Vollenhovia emeryi]|uniref:uncharacterized protein LOC105558745 isoform X2 n=1 Tax=Vollenhovia emeryi TaxID=411798 RepID=UPI0005F3EFBA|nr:PREDICTED: uncharacterized protein LOC105558745 isoform X2 [Vollenhovia emeryi]
MFVRCILIANSSKANEQMEGNCFAKMQNQTFWKNTLENAEQLDLPEATKPENAEQLDLPEATKPENAEQLDLPEATIHSNEVENIESYKDVEITAYTTASNVKESQHCTNTARITASNCKTYDEKYVTKLRKTLKKMVQRNKIMKRKLREKDARLKKIFNDDNIDEELWDEPLYSPLIGNEDSLNDIVTMLIIT